MSTKQAFLCVIFLFAILFPAPPTARGSAEESYDPLITGKFGQAFTLTEQCHVIVPAATAFQTLPMQVEFWGLAHNFSSHNIFTAMGPKSDRGHWEIYTQRDSGFLCVYIPQWGDFVSTAALQKDRWYHIAILLRPDGFELRLDGKTVLANSSTQKIQVANSSLFLGTIENDGLNCDGAMDDLKISRGSHLPDAPPTALATKDADTLFLFDFELGNLKNGALINLADAQNPAYYVDPYVLPEGSRFLDEVQDEAYSRSTLHGDDMVEYESQLPIMAVKAKASKTAPGISAPEKLSLNGQWRLKSSAPRKAPSLEINRFYPEESEGVKAHWYDPKTDRSQWLNVRVPTSVQNALLNTPAPDLAATDTQIEWLTTDFRKDSSFSRDYREVKTSDNHWEGIIDKAQDPWTQVENLRINADRNKALFLKLTIENAGGMQIFFIPEGATASESLSVKITGIPTGNKPTVFQIDMSKAKGWRGVITGLRIDIDGAQTGSGVKLYGIGQGPTLLTAAPAFKIHPPITPTHIEDPFWDTNTYNELQDYGWPGDFGWPMRKTRIEVQDWWFARTFTVPAEWKGKSVRLYFDGIDYAGTVYVNGQSLGYHAGMFGGPELDITHIIHYGDQPNEVVVRIDAVTDAWYGHLKGSPGWGWHYGHLISLGIWRGVELQCVPAIEVEAPFVKVTSLKGRQATLHIEYYVRNYQADPAKVDITGTIQGHNFSATPIHFANHVSAPHGQSRFETEVVVEEASLWWPMNYGDQNLYTLNLAGQSGDACDVKTTVFGIRTIRMEALPGAKPEIDYRWQFVINDIPMFIKGANWCWSDPMLQCDPRKYEQLLELARRAGVQMFRAWGGGIIETDEFYRLCDEKGLMVYQEFPYCWMPPDFPMTDAAVLDDQVSRVVKRNRNHPSLVMWGGGNENCEISGADEGLFLVGRRCRQYDATRPYHRTDPWGGSIHNWGVFHNGEPIDASFNRLPSAWLGEFGCPSMNNYQECLKFLPETKLKTWPPAQDDGGILMHMNQFGYGDMAKVMRYADYGPIQSWPQYIEYTQMAQGDEISYATCLQRAGSYFNKGGTWFYKMTDLFPGHSWAVVGFYAAPKLSYYRAKQVYKPQAAFAYYKKYDWEPNEPFEATVYVSNDTGQPLKQANVTATVYGSDLKPLLEKQYTVASVGVSKRAKLDRIQLSLPADKIKPFLMAVSMRNAKGQLLSDQWYWFNFRVKTDAVKEVEKNPAWGLSHDKAPEAFKAYGELSEARLLTLPKVALAASVQREGRHGVLKIENRGDIPAFNVIIDHFPFAYGNFLEDNSFCLYPNQTREIAFDLADDQTTLDAVTIKAWNSEAVISPQ